MDLTFGYRSRVYVLWGRGNGCFEAPRLAIQELASVTAVGDFNGDGRSDLILGDNTGQLPVGVATLLLGRTDGSFDRGTVGLLIGPVVEADFNRDGKADLAGAYHAGTSNVVVSLNNGDGSFPSVTEYQIGLPVNYVYLLPGDVDGDGDLDLIRISDAGDGTVRGGTVL